MAEENSEESGRVNVSRLDAGRSHRGMMGPMMVDQGLRQAILNCWMMLPDDQRTPDDVEREMTRLLKRALEDMREDASSFGFTNPDA